MKRGILGWGWRERGTPLWWKPSPTPPLLRSYLTLSFPHEETSHQKTSPPLSPFTWLCLKTVKICCWLKTNPPVQQGPLLLGVLGSSWFPTEMNCSPETTLTCTWLFQMPLRMNCSPKTIPTSCIWLFWMPMEIFCSLKTTPSSTCFIYFLWRETAH